ncbi:MAG: tetratricopeptide repeat protein [Acidobacteriota bacterium]|nr:tetratricopeptide repeat protein [Acidobacteriota bacterium]
MTPRCLRLVLIAVCCALPLTAPAQAGSDDAAAQYAAAGQQALAQGRYAEAQTNFEKLARLAPDVAEVHATLAAIYFKQRQYELAVQQVKTAQKLKPSLPRLDNLLGLSLAELGQFQAALPPLEKCFHQTEDPSAKRMCGLQLLRAYTGLGRDSDAVETSLALNKLYPDDPEVLYHTGRIYGNFAYIVMERLHDKAAGSVWMLQAQGEANESQKNYDAAIIAFNHVLVLDPKRPGIHYRLGRVYLAQFQTSRKPEERDAAMREFAAELAIDPGNGNAGYELANMSADMGNLDAARNQFQQVLKRFPDFEEALVGLGGVELESQKPAAAVPLLERATRLRPDDEVAWYRLAQAERGTGNKEGQAKALAAFRKLHSSTPVTLRKPNAGDEITPQQLDENAKP